MLYRLLLIVGLLAGFSAATRAQPRKPPRIPAGAAPQSDVPASVTDDKARGLYEEAQSLLSRDRKPREALAVWQELTSKYPQYGEPFLRQASLQLMLGDKAGAIESYKQGLGKLPLEAARAGDYLMLGREAAKVGDYEAMKLAFGNYLKVASPTARELPEAQLQLANLEFASQAQAHPTGPAPEALPAPLNQFRDQYFPVLTADNRSLIFTSPRTPAQPGNENEDILISTVSADGTFGAPVSISPAINSRENEGAATISGDGQTLVFTSCGRAGGMGSCDLYISRRRGSQWSPPRNMGTLVNSSTYDTQPSLSADGRTLYFASVRKGGQGGLDIYVTTVGEDGTWTPARNLGPVINTPRNEQSPFIHASGTTLYLISDGRPGMGGLDAYRSVLSAKGEWQEPTNLGYPLNTATDDASIFVSSDNRRVYCTRSTPAPPDNPPASFPIVRLFGSEVPASARARETSTYAQGRVFDAVTRKPLNAVVRLFDLNTNALTQQVYSDPETGEYTAVLNEGRAYAMYATAPGYLLKSLSFDYSSRQKFDPLTLDIYLDPAKSGRSAVLNNLFFDTGKALLKPRSRTELDRLVEFLRQDVSLRVEVAGHTDNVGNKADNLALSQRRAQAVLDYLTTHGIAAARLRAHGYGETKPLGANDSEASRARNRRIELQIL